MREPSDYDNDAENDAIEVSELDTLKARADQLGLSYHPSIGVEKLREKISKALADAPEETEVTEETEEPTSKAKQATPKVESEAEKRRRLKREASELVRLRITCMNPNKAEWEGEIFSCGNGLIGTFKKYVPYNVEWHVPRIIYHMIRDRQCQIFQTVKDERGNRVRRGKLINEFAIEVLPNLTEQELQELARRQAMAKSIDA